MRIHQRREVALQSPSRQVALTTVEQFGGPADRRGVGFDRLWALPLQFHNPQHLVVQTLEAGLLRSIQACNLLLDYDDLHGHLDIRWWRNCEHTCCNSGFVQQSIAADEPLNATLAFEALRPEFR